MAKEISLTHDEKNMTTLTFDRLTYLETLKASGVPEAQAKAHTTALDEALRDSVATKADVASVEMKIEIAKNEVLKWMFGGFLTLAGMMFAILLKVF
jgi:hypothetical protein